MKAIIQRVTKSSVTVGEEQISSIGRGLCVLLGISVEDTQKDVDYISDISFIKPGLQDSSSNKVKVRKILNLRLFEDENGRAWSRSVMDRELEVLCVSQFTLQCILKGNKPDFHSAMPAELAQPFYNNMLEQLREAYKAELIKDGQFGAKMQVLIQNDGPVTIQLESPAGPTDPKLLSKQEKQQQRKEKTRSKGPSESSREKAALRSKAGASASSGAEGDVSSEREP
uniref:D-aminoacyl-tRNA deacylase 1 n=1 Tax=Cyprinus carpio carpio TaxID=630221 RepID=A0A8C1D4W1_CYPCA